MSRQWVHSSEGCVGRVVVTLLVLSVVNVSVPALADQVAPGEAPSTISTTHVSIPPGTFSLAQQGSRRIRAMFERSAAGEARPLGQADQAGSAAEKSGHWCAGGLALLVGGVAAAVVAGTRRNYNGQKPSPPVGVVLGTGAAAVGGITMLRVCKW